MSHKTSSTSSKIAAATDYGTPEDRLLSFVKCFVNEFEARLHFYYLILSGEMDTMSNLSGSYTEKIMEYAGQAGGGVVGFLIGFASMGAEAGKTGGKFVGEKLSGKMKDGKRERIANKLWELMKFRNEKKSEFRIELIRAATDVFRSYEHQLVKVNNNKKWKQGMTDLAKDGVHRGIDYCATSEEDCNLKMADVISKGVVRGKSKYVALKIFQSYIQPKLVYSDGSVKIKWTARELYEKTGVVLNEDGSYSYFEKKDNTSKVSVYGYRQLLPSEDWAEMKEKFKPSKEENPFKNYVYQVNVSEEKIMANIEADENHQNLKNNQYMKEVLDEVKSSIQNEISQLQLVCADKHSKDFELLSRISHHVKKINLDEIKESIVAIRTEQKEYHEENMLSHEVIQEGVKSVKQDTTDIKNMISEFKPSPDKKPIWFNVQKPVDLFTGRKEELNELNDKISRQDVSKTVVCGLGGVGKTQLVRMYIQRYARANYENIIWIDSENESQLSECFIRLATESLQIKNTDINGEKKQMKTIVKDVYEVLSKSDTLIVFDNVEKICSDYQPNISYPDSKKLHVVFTSRVQKWGIGVVVLNLKELSMPDGVELVKKGLKDESQDDDVKKLLEKLQYYPLTIIQAILYINGANETGDFSIDDFLKEYDENTAVFLDSKIFQNLSNDPYAKTTYTTWSITTKKIRSNEQYGRTAIKILSVMSYLAPQNIKREMFLEIAHDDEKKLIEAVHLLVRYSMISGDNKQRLLSVHRLVQEVTRQNLKTIGEEEKYVIVAAKILSGRYDLADELKSKDEILEGLPHLETLLTTVKYAVSRDKVTLKETYVQIYDDFTRLLTSGYFFLGNSQKVQELLEEFLIVTKEYKLDYYQLGEKMANLGHAYGNSGDDEKMKKFLERALSIEEKNYGPNHYNLAPILGNLARAYGNLGDVRKEKELLERALNISEQHYGPEHFQVATVLLSFGSVHGKLGNFEKEKELLERALSINEKHYDPGHYQIAASLGILGCTYGKLGDFEKQKELLERALAINENHYGPDHQQVAATLGALGNAYGSLGYVQTKKELLERALVIEENYYGPDHYKITTLLRDLANAYEKLRYTQKTKELLERALIITENHFGRNHYQVASILVELARAYGILDEIDKQKESLERALIINENHYSPDLKSISSIYFNLCVAYKNDIQKAKEYLEKALIIYMKLPGSDDSVVATMLYNLGNAYSDLGDFEKMKEAFEKALIIYEKLYGPDHLQVAAILVRLARAYKNLGIVDKPKDLLERALLIEEKHLAPDDLQVAMILANLAAAYWDLNDIQKVKESLKRALIINEKHHGPDHYQVAVILVNLARAYRNLGDLLKASDLFERALRIEENRLGPDHCQLAMILTILGNTYCDLGDFEKAKASLEKALIINEKRYGSEHYQVASILDHLGIAYSNLRDVEKAKELLERALGINEKHYGPDHSQVAATLEKLGFVYGELGDVQKQKETLERALVINEKHFGSEHERVTLIVENLRYVYEKLNDTHREKGVLERDSMIKEKLSGCHYPMDEKLQGTGDEKFNIEETKEDSKRISAAVAEKRSDADDPLNSTTNKNSTSEITMEEQISIKKSKKSKSMKMAVYC